jgi:hypothetical protein
MVEDGITPMEAEYDGMIVGGTSWGWWQGSGG